MVMLIGHVNIKTTNIINKNVSTQTLFKKSEVFCRFGAGFYGFYGLCGF